VLQRQLQTALCHAQRVLRAAAVFKLSSQLNSSLRRPRVPRHQPLQLDEGSIVSVTQREVFYQRHVDGNNKVVCCVLSALDAQLSQTGAQGGGLLRPRREAGGALKSVDVAGRNYCLLLNLDGCRKLGPQGLD
jgi:hypothetical protein